MRFSTVGAVAIALISTTAVHAAGGAHVVDDSEVEQPRNCHIEAWISRYGRNSGLFNLGPACTPYAPGNIEIDTDLARGWSDGRHVTIAGAGAKWTLRPESRGLGIGVSAFLDFDVGRRQLELATFNLPVTIPVNQVVRVNLNVGGEWSQTLRRWTMTSGAQAEITVRANWEMMVEALARSGGRKGFQLGPRWTVDKGRVDLDLLYARFGDGATRNALTFGVTIRR